MKRFGYLLMSVAAAAAATIFGLGSVGYGDSIQVFNVPPFTENQSTESMTKTNVPRPTLVQMDPFSALAPSGWSFVAAGLSEKMDASLTITPSSDIEHDETYVGIVEKKTVPPVSVAVRLEKFKKEHQDAKTEVRTINGVQWAIGRYTSLDPKSKKKSNRWIAFAVSDGREFWVLAGNPDEKTSQYSSEIENIIDSIKFGGGKNDSKDTTAVDAVKSSILFTIDPRLKDKWKIVSYKMDEGPGLWTDDDAKNLVGTSVIFKEKEVTIGGITCHGTAKPFGDEDMEQSLLRDVGNPCGGDVPDGPIFSLSRNNCSDKTSFPPYLALEGKGNVIAFGDAISFCLKHDDGK